MSSSYWKIYEIYFSTANAEKSEKYLVVLVSAVVLTDEAHDGGRGLALVLEADKLCGVCGVGGAAGPLAGLLRQWHAPVLGQRTRGV